MSLIKAIKAQLGLSVTPANNFTLDASADNGTMKLARNSGQDIMTVDAAGKPRFNQLAQSLTGNGYKVLEGGLIIQWGYSAGGAEPFVVTFPTPFTVACFTVNITSALPSDPGSSVTHTVSSVSTTNFTVYRMEVGATSVTPINWIAIGY